MQIEEREIEADQVRIGMFVCRLDRPWTDTPFPLQGFLVHDLEQIETLRTYCRKVWIDVELGQAARGALEPGARMAAPAPRASATPPDPRFDTARYADAVDLLSEMPAAREALDAASAAITGLVDRARAGEPLSSEAAHAAARPIVASVLRNADALFWLNALRQRDGYAYSHALNCSALAAAFGRHLGLPQDLLIELSTGAMLLDIGKTQVPQALLDHPGRLDPLAMARVRRHVELGAQMLAGGDFGDIVRDMVQGHHERVDGSGYPARAREASLPLHVRIAGIVDSFDAMTSARPHAAAMARHEALQELYRERGTRYSAELVEQFISCLGVYPTGSLAELSTGEIVAVMAQNPARRLRPRVLVLTDADGALLDAFRSVDLLTATDLEIRRPLPDGHEGIALSELYL